MMVTIALAVSVTLNVCLSALLFRLSTTSLSRLDQSHERTVKYTEGLVDRLMAVDYEKIHADRLEAAFEGPEPAPPVQLVPVRGPDLGGFGSQLGLRGWTPPLEQPTEEDLTRELP